LSTAPLYRRPPTGGRQKPHPRTPRQAAPTDRGPLRRASVPARLMPESRKKRKKAKERSPAVPGWEITGRRVGLAPPIPSIASCPQIRPVRAQRSPLRIDASPESQSWGLRPQTPGIFRSCHCERSAAIFSWANGMVMTVQARQKRSKKYAFIRIDILSGSPYNTIGERKNRGILGS